MSTLRDRARKLIVFAGFTTLFACLTSPLAAQTTGKDNWFPNAPANAPAPTPQPAAPAPAAPTPVAPAPAAQPTPAPAPTPAPSPTTKPGRKPPATQPAPVVWTQTTAPRNDYSKDPAKTLILNPEIPWTYWNGATQATGCSRKDGFTRFVINEPGGRDIWSRSITTAPLWERYPILVMRYRTTGLARKNAGHALAFSDGSGQFATSVTPLMYEHFVSDGEIHEVRADLRLCPKGKAINPGNVIGNLSLALKADIDQTLVFDLYEIRFEADPDKPNPPIKSDLQGTITVTDSSGQGIVGAMVRPAGEWANLAPEVRTDAKGQARLQWGTGESFGTYTFEGYKSQITVVATKPGHYTGVASHNLPLEFGSNVSMCLAQKISGTLVDDDGKSVAGAGIYLQIAESRGDGNRGINASQHVITDTQGKWETDPLPALQNNISVYVVKLSDKRYVSRQYYLGANADTQASKDVQITGQTGNKFIIQKGVILSGRTLDKENKPILGVRVGIARNQDGSWQNQPITPEVRSDKMGLYKLGPIPAGTYTLSVIPLRNAPQWPTITVAKSSEPVLFDINLEPTKPIKARIVDADGKPIPLPSLSCYRWKNYDINFNARANPEGKFTWFAPPLDFVDIRITPDVKADTAYEVSLYPSDEEYTIKLLSDGKYTVTPEPIGPPLKPIPAPEKLSQPTPNQSIVINLQTPQAMQWNSNEPGTGGTFANPSGLTLLWQNSNFGGQGAYFYPTSDLQDDQRLNIKKIIVQYRATTEPAWQPDIPLSPSRERVGFCIQSDFNQAQTDTAAADFVPDGKLREMIINIPASTSNQRHMNAYYIHMAQSSQVQKVYSGKIQSVKVDLTRLWVETTDPLPAKAQPYKQIVRVLDAKNKPLAGCTISLHPGSNSLASQTTDASGTAFFQGTARTAPQHAFIQTPSGQTYSTPLQPGITTYTLPLSVAHPFWPMRSAPSPQAKMPKITGVVSTPTGPASGAIVWVGRSAQEWRYGTTVLTNEKGEFTLTGNSLANGFFPRMVGPGQQQGTMKIYARLHDMAMAQPLPAADAHIAITLVPVVRPQITIKDIKTVENGGRHPNIEVAGYSMLQLENYQTFKIKRPSLIAGDIVEIKGSIDGYQPLSLPDIKVTPDMAPITLEFQPGYKALITFVDDQGAALPNLSPMVGRNYAARTNTDAKGQTLIQGLIAKENTGNIIRWGDRFATHLGDGSFKFNIQPGDPGVTQNVQVTLFWHCKLKVIDQTTGEPIPVAYANTQITVKMPLSTFGTFNQESIDNSKYIWCKITAQDVKPLPVSSDGGTLIVCAPGYKPAQLTISKTDPAPRNYEVKLQKETKPAP